MIMCLLSWGGLLLAFLGVLVVGFGVGTLVAIVGIENQRKFEEEERDGRG